MRKVGLGTKIYEPVVIIDDNKHEILIGRNCRIGQFSIISPRKFIMRDGAEIGNFVMIAGGGDVTLGQYSTINFGAKLIPATYATEGQYMNDVIPEKSKMIRGSITIGDGAYVGSGAIICVSKKFPHIVIGNHAVIGALTYIDRSIPDNVIVHAKQTLIMKERKRE